MKKSIAIISAILIYSSCAEPKEQKQQVQEISGFDLAAIDSGVSVCDNFFQHAVGNWINENPIPETESRWSSFNVLAKENKLKCIKLLDGLKDKIVEANSSEKHLKNVYLSAFQTRDNKDIVAEFASQVNAISNYGDLIELFGKLRRSSVKSPLSFYIGQDRKNSDQNIVYASQSGLNLPDRDYYLEYNDKFTELRKTYVKAINDISNLINLPFEGEKVLSVETKLAKIFWTREESRDPVKTYNKMAFSDWNNSLDNLDINRFIEGLGLGQFDSLIVTQNSYFDKLNAVIIDISLSDWKNYLNWNIARALAPYYSEESEQLNHDFFSGAIRGTKKMLPKEERVYATINNLLGEPLGKLFVEKHFDEESKKYVGEMIENLRFAYRESIESLTWMSDSTKLNALKKLESFSYKVGYPDKWKDYSVLQTDENNYLQNVLNCRDYNVQFMLDKLNKPVDRDEWGMKPHQVNAYYRGSNNEIVFPAGILQPPFFHIDNDKAINYGGIGSVIGHEFTHGFDDKGSQYDWNGNLKNWWTSEDREAFEALAAKVIEQYNQYEPLPEVRVNGKYTIGENIADFGGVSLSYSALMKSYGNEYPEPKFGYSWNQQFFLGYANVWKGSMTPEEQLRLIKSDTHSPNEYRVNGPLVNFKPFEEAFGVCKNHNMHKADSSKIKIW